MKKLGFGLMRLPLLDADDPATIDLGQVCRMVDRFLENGFCYFDTAYVYHKSKSEEAVRKALVERHPRESFLLADKMPTWMITSSEDYPSVFDEQLARCGVEYFDYYLLHSMGEENYAKTLKHGGFDFMKKVKASGRAKKIGLSFHDKAATLDKILTAHPEMEFVQLQINYADWEDKGIESRKCYETAVRHGKPVIAMEPVKGGSLADIPGDAKALFLAHNPGASVASWAVRYAASLEHVIMVLSGMSNLAQLEDNIASMKDLRPLDDAEREIIAKAVGIIAAGTAIPCTACRYCVDDCPQNIAIPEFFSLYNNQHQYGLKPMHASHHTNLIVDHGKASDCIACRQCEAHCPQHINIVEQLEAVAQVFER